VSGVEGVVILLIAATVVAVVARWVKIQFTLALLLFGLALGASPIPAPVLSSDVVLLLFLPPLLFEAAFVLDPKTLWNYRVAVAALAVLGVVLATAASGAVVHVALELPWVIALLFGAMVASTDPVAVLASFRSLGANRGLTFILEGESLFNDATALMLFGVLVGAVNGGVDLNAALLSFVILIAGGVALGVVLGWFGHLLIAHTDEHLTEMTISVATAYGSFLAAERLHCSAVLSTIAAAMTLGYLGRTKGWVYSDGSERLLIDLWDFLAFVANAALFLAMGLTVSVAGLREHPEAVGFGIVAAIGGRAAVAYVVGGLLNRTGNRLSWPERHMLFWGGLRGAVALATALSLPPDFPYRSQLLAMTYGVVLFTLVVQGLPIGWMVRKLGLLEPESRPASFMLNNAPSVPANSSSI
jgi:CPA1 family monovalent cation:H+ antiporter